LNKPDIIERTADHVRQVHSADSSGHDWSHVDRVRKLAVRIGQAEGADLFVAELAALLHDIADWKFHGGDEMAGPRAAREWLGVERPIVDQVCDIIARLSFKGAGVADHMPTLEGQVVQDADRLDAIGAIGIARTFAYGGHAGRALHDPAVPPQQHDTFEQYKQGTGPSVNHFYEKLVLLRDRMNTVTARKIAEQRHEVMQQFLEQFLREWNLDDVEELSD